MAASRRGLCRALHSSPHPAWKRAQSGAGGRLKPEYDAVVIGAGKAKEGRARAQRGKATPFGGSPGSPAAALAVGTAWPGVPVSRACDGVPLVWESGVLGSGSILGLLCGLERFLPSGFKSFFLDWQ